MVCSPPCVLGQEYIQAATAKEGKKLFVPPLRLCGDNAAMIGCQAYYEYLDGKRAGSDLNAYATMEIDKLIL